MDVDSLFYFSLAKCRKIKYNENNMKKIVKTDKVYKCGNKKGKLGILVASLIVLTSLSFVPYGLRLNRDTSKLKYLTNDVVQKNCELLGVNYNCYGLTNASDFFSSSKDVEKNLYVAERKIPGLGNLIKVYVEDLFTQEQIKLMQEVIDEINYIAKNIGDPIRYELLPYSDQKKLRDCDIKVSLVSSDDVSNFDDFGGRVFVKYKEKDGHTYMTNPCIQIKNTRLVCEDGDNFQRVFAHELAGHLIYCGADIKTFDNEDTNLIDKQNIFWYSYKDGKFYEHEMESSENKSIMNMYYTFTSGDILLWAAKNSVTVSDDRDSIVKFAYNYESQKLLSTYVYAREKYRDGKDVNLTLFQKLQEYRRTYGDKYVETQAKIKYLSVENADNLKQDAVNDYLVYENSMAKEK